MSKQAAAWIVGLIVVWYIVASIALHPGLILYVLAHLATTGVFVFAIRRSEQRALARPTHDATAGETSETE